MNRPPPLAERLLGLVLDPRDSEVIQGDLAEEYATRLVPQEGEKRARLWYWRQVLSTVLFRLIRIPARMLQHQRKRGPRRDGRMGMLWQDVHFTLRSLRKNPAFTAIVLLTLALGIATNATVYSVVDNLILNPFSFPDQDTLVGVGPIFPRLNRELGFWEVLSPVEYMDIKSRSRSLVKVVAWDMGNRQVAGEGAPENVFSAFWWGNAFDTMRVSPALGRGFTLDETIRGDPVAIISYRFWQRRFGGDPGMVGKVIHVNGNPYTLIGIMPRGTLIYGTDLWIPMGVAPEQYPRGRRQFQVLARMSPGRTLSGVNAELETIAHAIEHEYGNEFKEYAGWSLVAETWTRINTQMLRPVGLILSCAVGFVMLMICANLGSLFLARGVRRVQELGVRAALGAGRMRIVSQLLTESMVYSLLGGTIGLALAYLSIRWIGSTVSSMPLPVAGQLEINGRVLWFTAVLSVLVGLVFGSIPALRITRPNLFDVLKSEGKSTTETAGKQRLQSIMVGIEVALAVVLLMGGGLLVRSFLRLQAVETGFDPENVLTMRLTLPREKYSGAQISVFFHTLVQRLEGLPGVLEASAASQFPPLVFSRQQLQIEGREARAEGELPTCYATLVTEGYFETLGIPILRGRGFNDQDRVNTPMVAVINEVVARRHFPGQDPVGKRIRVGRPDSSVPWLEVVGVAGSTHNRGLDVPAQPEVFASVRQAEGWWNQLFLLVKTEVEPMSVLGAIRTEVSALDPDQPVYAIQTVEGALSSSMAQRFVASTAVSCFALFALVLAAVGVFSVVSYRIAARMREIGLRLALGATPTGVRRRVVTQAMVPVAIGAGVGLPAGMLLGGLMKNLLFRIGGTDILTVAGVTMLLGSAAFLASYLPAYRASTRDPVRALRYE